MTETPVVARQVLSELVKLLQDQTSALGQSLQGVLQAVLKIVAPRGVTFDEQASLGFFWTLGAPILTLCSCRSGERTEAPARRSS